MTGARAAVLTGASGFIGRHLAARLIRDGWDVTCAGRRDPGVPGGRFLPVGRLVDDLAYALRDIRADTVFHLAAYGVSPKDRDPAEAFSVNVAGADAVVRAAAAIGATTIVYAGSCSEYAEAVNGTPIGEDHPLTGGELYGASKAAGGLWGRALAEKLGLAFIHLRLFGVYGAGEAPHRMLPSIVAALSRGERAPLSPGLQIRDMLHVDDVVEGFLRAGTLAKLNSSSIYNLCLGRPVSVRNFALLIAQACGAEPERLDFGALAMRPGEPMWRVGDGSAFAAATGFAPTWSLRDGVTRAVAALGSHVPTGVSP